MAHIEMKSRVGPDGVLNITVPVGASEANREVKVTVESIDSASTDGPVNSEEWRRFVEEMAGSIPDPTFRRHEQGEYEDRGERRSARTT